MKFLDKVGLVLFSNLILILSVILCLLVFGWLDMENVYFIMKTLQLTVQIQKMG